MHDSIHYVVVYAGQDDGSLLSLDTLQPLQVGVYRVRCHDTPAGWRIARLTGEASFGEPLHIDLAPVRRR